MSTLPAAISPAIEAAARAAGLTLTPIESGTDFTGNLTDRATVSLSSDPAKSQLLELSEGFNPTDAKFAAQLTSYFAEAAQRLRNPRPDCYLSTIGIPLSFGNFAWPFHGSTSGADTSIVHGDIHLQDGTEPTLHAKVSASLTRTFAEVVPALEQPFAEGFVYNAVRKTLDQGQIELVKSGNRQPVPVTTRYYSAKQGKFIFNDTDTAERANFLAGKVFWLSHILGNNAPVWLSDPRDAQYLNTTPEELTAATRQLAVDGLIQVSEPGWATPTEKLTAQRDQFFATLADGLAFTKPTFNEEMRSGKANM